MRDEYMTYDMKLCEVRDETWDEAWGKRGRSVRATPRLTRRGGHWIEALPLVW